MKQQVTINFAQLAPETKQRCMQFLAENNISHDDYLLDKVSMPQHHKARQQSTLGDIQNCKAFTPAQQSRKEIPKDIRQPKFYDLDAHYPEIMKNLNNKQILSRPLKLTLDELLNLQEEILQTKFQENSLCIQQNKPNTQSLAQFVFEHIMRKHKKQQAVVNFLGSIEVYSKNKRQVSNFRSLLMQDRQDNLTFYLFMRAIIQKEMNQSFWHILKKKAFDLSITPITLAKIYNVITVIYGDLQNASIYTKGMPIAEFQFMALEQYQRLYQVKHMQNYKSESTTTNDISDYENLLERIRSSQITDIEECKASARFRVKLPSSNECQSQINQKLEVQIADFIDDILSELEDITESDKQKCFHEIQAKVSDIVSSLLDSVYKCDKMIWYLLMLKRLKRIQNTDEKSVQYIENLQKQYRQITKGDHDIETLCTALMQTPELARNIGNELANYFYKINQ